MNKFVRYILLFLLAALVVIQFFPTDKTNPPSDPASDFIAIENPPQPVATMLKNTCYDCHSNHTEYPWYTHIQPVGWWIQGHYRHARQELNFSEWREFNPEDKPKMLREMAEEVEEKHMPLKSYTWMHPEGRLTDEQRKELTGWFRSKAGGSTSGQTGHDDDHDDEHDDELDH